MCLQNHSIFLLFIIFVNNVLTYDFNLILFNRCVRLVTYCSLFGCVFLLMNKTKVMISGERQMVRQKDVRWLAGSAVKVSVAIQYSVVVARNGYIRNVVV